MIRCSSWTLGTPCLLLPFWLPFIISSAISVDFPPWGAYDYFLYMWQEYHPIVSHFPLISALLLDILFSCAWRPFILGNMVWFRIFFHCYGFRKIDCHHGVSWTSYVGNYAPFLPGNLGTVILRLLSCPLPRSLLVLDLVESVYRRTQT